MDRRRLADIESGKTPEPEKTFAWYWLKNGEDSEYFHHQDVVFECFHNFVAFSQWGNSLYNVMAKLGRDAGDPQAKDWFPTTMAGDFDKPDGSAFPPLERFVMELFRMISPNGGSISAWSRRGRRRSSATPTSRRPIPRPAGTRCSGRIPTPSIRRATRRRPPARTSTKPEFGRWVWPSARSADGLRGHGRPKAALRNSAFGTVFGVVDDQPLPVCDYAGFAPFGFGYRRCPGEQLTLMAFEDLLRKVARERIEFVKVGGADAEKLPIVCNTVIGDDIGFRYR